MTYQTPITGLHSPTLLLFLQNSTDNLMLAQSCKFGVICYFIGVTHPAACTRARVPLTFGHVHRPPPLTQFAQKGCQSTGLEPRIPMIYLKFRRSGPVNFWRGGPKNSGPSPAPPPPAIGPIYIPINSSRRQDPEYINFNQFDTCHPKDKLPTPSWKGVTFWYRNIWVTSNVQFRKGASIPPFLGGEWLT